MAFKKQNTGFLVVISFVVFSVVDSLVFLLANVLFPQNVVLGNLWINKTWAIIHSVGTLALVNILAIPFVRVYENYKNKMLGVNEWMGVYFVINFVTVWVMGRLAKQLGFGISSWVVAAFLAVALDVFQGVAMMLVEKLRKKYPSIS
ncbi:hypothetical protein JXA63_03525 [Candidatus Woesebacteria bacterium]|nr:hypothetical protein [Candidatus Woesebacteria bacterium]